jgi:hypothetical protein
MKTFCGLSGSNQGRQAKKAPGIRPREGLGYSLMLSIRNVALFGADIVGSNLADHKWPFASLVYLNAGTTAIVLVLLPFMPAALMHTKDQPANTTAG